MPAAAGHPRQCSATSKQTGRRCEQFAQAGADVCKWHGADSPGSKRAAMVRLAEQEALGPLEAWLVLNPPEPITDPVAALAALAGRFVRALEFFESEAATLTSYATTTDTGTEQVVALVTLYERFCDRTARIVGDVAMLNLDERVVRITERQGAAIVSLLEGVIADLSLSPELEEAARESVGRRLALVAGGN